MNNTELVATRYRSMDLSSNIWSYNINLAKRYNGSRIKMPSQWSLKSENGSCSWIWRDRDGWRACESQSFPQINIYVCLLTFVLYKLVLGRFVLNVLERLGPRSEMAREIEIEYVYSYIHIKVNLTNLAHMLSWLSALSLTLILILILTLTRSLSVWLTLFIRTETFNKDGQANWPGSHW